MYNFNITYTNAHYSLVFANHFHGLYNRPYKGEEGMPSYMPSSPLGVYKPLRALSENVDLDCRLPLH